MEPIHPSEARMKPNSCSPALAMARSKARAGSVAGAEGGVCKGRPWAPEGGGVSANKLLLGPLLPMRLRARLLASGPGRSWSLEGRSGRVL